MADKKYQYTIDQIGISLIYKARFFTALLSKMAKIALPKHQMPTAAVGFNQYGKPIFMYNEQFVLSQKLEVAQSIMIHELGHLILRHISRLSFSKDKGDAKDNHLKNIAADMVVNQFITHFWKEPEPILPEIYNFPRDKTAEWYYEELKKLPKNENGDPQRQDGKKSSLQTIDDHSKWELVFDMDDDSQGKEGSFKDASSEGLDIDKEFEVQKMLEDAVNQLKSTDNYGEIPAMIRRELENLKVKKRHDWKQELRIFVNSVLTSRKRLSQKRVNRRLMGKVDYYLPGKKKSRKPSLILARDTSGSVFNDKIQGEFLNEMINISKNCEVLVIDCDTEIHQSYRVRNQNDFKVYTGGGGTSFEPVFEEAKKRNVDGIIYLTDTDGSFPNIKDIGKLAYKTIWVTVDENRSNLRLPFGKHVNIKSEES